MATDLFEKLGWWSVPLAGAVGACVPFTTRSGRRGFAGGDFPVAMLVIWAIVGAGAAVLLLTRARIRHRGARLAFTIVFGFFLALIGGIGAVQML